MKEKKEKEKMWSYDERIINKRMKGFTWITIQGREEIVTDALTLLVLFNRKSWMIQFCFFEMNFMKKKGSGWWNL